MVCGQTLIMQSALYKNKLPLMTYFIFDEKPSAMICAL